MISTKPSQNPNQTSGRGGDKRGVEVKWSKRLKILRISKVVIPIALAVSLLFAGFAVFAREAENFVVHVTEPSDVKLLLDYDENFTNPTTRLVVPIGGKYEDVTYTPNQSFLYGDVKKYSGNLPDDIAQQEGVHSVYEYKNALSFFSFSFYLKNDSDRAVDIDMTLKVDEVVVSDKNGAHHVDGAVRVMFIEGKPLLSENTYRVYKMPEKSEEEETASDGMGNGLGNVAYGNVEYFESSDVIFSRTGEEGYRTVSGGEILRFTVVIWLEGFDPDCVEEVRYDSMKMSLNFQGW